MACVAAMVPKQQRKSTDNQTTERLDFFPAIVSFIVKRNLAYLTEKTT